MIGHFTSHHEVATPVIGVAGFVLATAVDVAAGMPVGLIQQAPVVGVLALIVFWFLRHIRDSDAARNATLLKIDQGRREDHKQLMEVLQVLNAQSVEDAKLAGRMIESLNRVELELENRS